MMIENKVKESLKTAGLVTVITVSLSTAWFLGFVTGKSAEYNSWVHGDQMDTYLEKNDLKLVPEKTFKKYDLPSE